MRRSAFLVLTLVALAFASLVFGQDALPDAFTVYRQLGANPPVTMKYEPRYDQFAVVSTESELLLVDGETFLPTHTLYETGSYNAFQFSHDGRWLALALDRRVEVWDTQTGELSLTLEPDGANSVTGPLMFSDDDTFLVFTAVVAASQATRRSENDTDLLPWLWDLNAAWDLGDSRLPGRVDAYSFFDYRTGNLYMGPNNILLAAIPGRYHLIDAEAPRLVSFLDIETARFENDPVSLWFSAAGDLMYVLKEDTGTLVQVDTRSRTTFEMPLGRSLGARTLQEFENFSLGNEARIIGEPNSREINPLVRALFGYDYRSDWNYHPLTIMLLDVLIPQTAFAADPGIIVYFFDEETGTGTVEFIKPADDAMMALHPDQQNIALRDVGFASPITVYNLDTGLPDLRFDTSLRDPIGSDLFTYDGTGTYIQAGYQRYFSDSGAVLYELLDYNLGWTSYTFTDDSRNLITMNDTDWWMWNIAEGTVIRRETLNFNGSVRQIWRDGQRFLLDITGDDGRPGIEVYDVGKDQRQQVFFDVPPDMSIRQIIPSPTWTNFLVLYDAFPGSLQYPTGALATYTMGIGRRTFIAGADLPANAFETGWLDDDTVYMASNAGGGGAPERVYGVDYDPSGVPACLAERYPDQVAVWTLIWERIVFYQPADVVARLAQAVCEAPDAAAVDALYTPVPTWTPAPIATNALVRIAGVPECLTQRYPDQALAYAREWRALTQGMTDPQIEELAVLLCESIGSAGEFEGGYTGLPRGGVGTLYTVINAATGMRTRVPSLPDRPDTSPAVNLVEQEFREQFGYYPSNPVLSPDRSLMAVSTAGGHVLIYRLEKSYDTLVIEATSTAAGTAQAIPNAIRVRPTATREPDILGTPGPTLTPTIIPTAIPLATQTAVLAQANAVEEVCPAPEPVLFSERPEGFTPRGRIIGRAPGSNDMWVLNLEDGELHPDETIPTCGGNLNCNLNFSQEWMVVQYGGLYVLRPDGSDFQVVMTEAEAQSVLQGFDWYDENRLRLTVTGYLPDETLNELTLRQLYDIRDGSFTTPERLPDSVTINDLPTDVVSAQPNGGTLRVLTTPLNLPGGTGYRYYLYNTATGESEYFARSEPSQSIVFEWQPLGETLYYFPSWMEEGYIYDPATGEHSVLAVYPSGFWSRDARYRFNDFYTLPDDVEEREEAGLPIPTMKLWDTQTGLTRLYCPPPQWRDMYTVEFSPDNRYIALLAAQPGDQSEQTRQYNTVYIVDTMTGVVVDMQADMDSLFVWTEGRR